MKKKVINVNYNINGVLKIVPTILFYEEDKRDDELFSKVYFKFTYDKQNITSKTCSDMEYAIIYL